MITGIKNNANKKSVTTFGIINESLLRFGVRIKVTITAPVINIFTNLVLSAISIFPTHTFLVYFKFTVKVYR
jgi:hypothetical protein